MTDLVTPAQLKTLREQAEAADQVHRDHQRRDENDAIRAMLEALDAALNAADIQAEQRARHQLKTALIKANVVYCLMSPGNDRRWVATFLNMATVWCDLRALPEERDDARDVCVRTGARLLALRGLS